MALLSAAVNIITTDGIGGRAGFTATAVCSVTAQPPTLLVCLNRTSSAYKAVRANGVLCVNILKSHHEDIGRLFGGKTPIEERFAAGRWSALSTGAPALDDGLVSFDCKISDVASAGTHEILICEIVAIRQNDVLDEPLIYFDRNYRRLRV